MTKPSSDLIVTPDQLIAVGQLMFRDGSAGIGIPEAPKGKKLMMVFGIMAIPEDTLLKPEHQYTIAGHEVHEPNIMLGRWHIMLDSGVDRTDYHKGLDVSGLLTSPIWKVG